jgi:hypothetical protein
MKQKTRSRDRCVEKPQRRKTDSVDPIVVIEMHVVTCHRSTDQPMNTHPQAAAMLIKVTVSAETVFDAPRLFAYVGR